MKLHVQQIAIDLAVAMLAHGVGLAYGGNLNTVPFSKPVFDRIRDFSDEETRPRKTRLRLWLAPSDLKEAVRGPNHTIVPVEAPADDRPAELTAMRRAMTRAIAARVLVGGAMRGKGHYPGLLEEAWLAVEHRTPTYVLGGFGGATEAVAAIMRGEHSPTSWVDYVEPIQALRAGVNDNGLSTEENAALMRCQDIDQAIGFVLRGLWVRGLRA